MYNKVKCAQINCPKFDTCKKPCKGIVNEETIYIMKCYDEKTGLIKPGKDLDKILKGFDWGIYPKDFKQVVNEK